MASVAWIDLPTRVLVWVSMGVGVIVTAALFGAVAVLILEGARWMRGR